MAFSADMADIIGMGVSVAAGLALAFSAARAIVLTITSQAEISAVALGSPLMLLSQMQAVRSQALLDLPLPRAFLSFAWRFCWASAHVDVASYLGLQIIARDPLTTEAVDEFTISDEFGDVGSGLDERVDRRLPTLSAGCSDLVPSANMSQADYTSGGIDGYLRWLGMSRYNVLLNTALIHVCCWAAVSMFYVLERLRRWVCGMQGQHSNGVGFVGLLLAQLVLAQEGLTLICFIVAASAWLCNERSAIDALMQGVAIACVTLISTIVVVVAWQFDRRRADVPGVASCTCRAQGLTSRLSGYAGIFQVQSTGCHKTFFIWLLLSHLITSVLLVVVPIVVDARPLVAQVQICGSMAIDGSTLLLLLISSLRDCRRSHPQLIAYAGRVGAMAALGSACFSDLWRGRYMSSDSYDVHATMATVAMMIDLATLCYLIAVQAAVALQLLWCCKRSGGHRKRISPDEPRNCIVADERATSKLEAIRVARAAARLEQQEAGTESISHGPMPVLVASKRSELPHHDDLAMVQRWTPQEAEGLGAPGWATGPGSVYVGSRSSFSDSMISQPADPSCTAAPSDPQLGTLSTMQQKATKRKMTRRNVAGQGTATKLPSDKAAVKALQQRIAVFKREHPEVCWKFVLQGKCSYERGRCPIGEHNVRLRHKYQSNDHDTQSKNLHAATDNFSGCCSSAMKTELPGTFTGDSVKAAQQQAQEIVKDETHEARNNVSSSDQAYGHVDTPQPKQVLLRPDDETPERKITIGMCHTHWEESAPPLIARPLAIKAIASQQQDCRPVPLGFAMPPLASAVLRPYAMIPPKASPRTPSPTVLGNYLEGCAAIGPGDRPIANVAAAAGANVEAPSASTNSPPAILNSNVTGAAQKNLCVPDAEVVVTPDLKGRASSETPAAHIPSLQSIRKESPGCTSYTTAPSSPAPRRRTTFAENMLEAARSPSTCQELVVRNGIVRYHW